MKSKKVLLWIIALLFVFVIGCGDKEEEKNPTPDAPTVEEPTPEVPTQPDVPTEPDVPTQPDIPTQPVEPTPVVEYTVTLVVDGKEEEIKVKENEKVSKPDDPIKEGYAFAGWYSDENYTNAYDFEIEVTADFKLYAKFEVNNEEVKAKLEDALDEYIEKLGEYVDKDLETTYEKEGLVFNVSYEFSEAILADGKVNRPADKDIEVKGNVVFECNGVKAEKEVKLEVHGTFLDEIAKTFAEQFKNGINQSIAVKNSYPEFGTTRVVWESSDEEVFSNSGKYNRPFSDTEIEISYFLRSREPNAKHYYSIKVKVFGEPIENKTVLVKKWLEENFAVDRKLYKDTVLIDYVDDYKAKVEWLDTKHEKITDLSKYVQNEVLGLGYELNANITIDGASHIEKIYYRVWEEELTDKWKAVDLFLEAINSATLGSYEMKMSGYFTDHYGAVYFFNHDAPLINKDHMTTYTYGYVNTGIKKTSTEYVVVHDTAGGAPTHTAEHFALDQYNKNNNEKNTEYISWHYTVGDDGAYQSLPLDEVAYHAGDGSHVYGDIYYNSTYKKSDCIGGGNRNGIGIESCVNYGSNYNQTMKHLAKLIVRELFPQFENLNLSRIKQHYHFSGKDCPYVIRHAIGWDKFMNFVAIENFGATELSDVEFEWKSLNADYLDETGNVIKNAEGKELGYEVKVTYNGETKTFTYKFTPEVYKYDEVIKYF